MPQNNFLNKIDLTHPKYLQTLVENRRVFNLKNCELNVFESYQRAFEVPLTFNDFVITSMVRGKKIMHLDNKPSFEYKPGETVIAPANETIKIDFPEAELNNPTQCIALAIDASYLDNTLQYLNGYYNSNKEEEHAWAIRFNQYHFANDTEISDLINKIIKICSGKEVAKDIYADLNLKELLIRLVQSQHLQQVNMESRDKSNATRLHFVLNYIQQHLAEKISIDMLSNKAYLSRNTFFKWFKEQFGITPVEYINRERLKHAKQLLSGEDSISNIAMQCGFSDVNYFVRLFKKMEGITPGSYQSCAKKSSADQH